MQLNKVQVLGRFLGGKTDSLDFTKPAPSLVRSDGLDLRERILELAQKEASELGISRNTLHFLRKHAEASGSFKIYQKVADKLM